MKASYMNLRTRSMSLIFCINILLCLLQHSVYGLRSERVTMGWRRISLRNYLAMRDEFTGLPQVEYEIGSLWGKKQSRGLRREDRRDQLPYQVFDITEISKNDPKSRTVLGKFQLDPSTACGDYLDLGGSNKTFMVKRVSFIYKYQNRRFEVVSKKLEVTAASPSWSKIVQISNEVDNNERLQVLGSS
eukprot:gene804-1565_t